MSKHKIMGIVLSLVLVTSTVMSYGISDNHIQSETIVNTYTGREKAGYIIDNIQFNDVASSYWAKEPITRLGALEVVKGHATGQYLAFNNISNEEVITLLMRAIGREEEAITLSEQIEDQEESNGLLTNIWSKGHLNVAMNLGLITGDNFDDALMPDQSVLNPEFSFLRENSVTREQVAKWLVQSIQAVNPNAIAPIYDPQALLNYDDFQEVGYGFAPYIEAVILEKIMVGDHNNFNPKDYLTRAEMAQILVNIDDILYDTMTIERKAGTILSVKDIENDQKDFTEVIQEFYIRSPQGQAEKIVYRVEKNIANIEKYYDAPVYKEGRIRGLTSLDTGDYIEYLVNTDNEVLYVTGTNHNTLSSITGILKPFTNIENGEITIKDGQGRIRTFIMDSNIYDSVNQTVVIDGQVTDLSDAKTGYGVKLSMINSLVTAIESNDTIYMDKEYSGIVKVNNSLFSYLTITDWGGETYTFNYFKDDVEVEKQNYYDEYDEIGYIDELFPHYEFDERDSSMDKIEPGDIVHIQLNSDGKIKRLSAKTNYIVKYANVKHVMHQGDSSRLSVQYDDGTESVFDIDRKVNVIKGAKVIDKNQIVAGDIIRLLVNEAVIAPGTIDRRIKEIVVDTYGNEVVTVYKGKWGHKDDEQETLSIFHTYELEKTGWEYTNQLRSLDISNETLACYYEDERISVNYANRYLNTASLDVYAVTTNYFGDEQLQKIVLREGRDSVLNPSNIITYNGLDEFRIEDQVAPLTLDAGTIVIKNNKLVESSNIVPPDYARVVINGNNNAAIVHIEQEPKNDALTIFRGRIASIDDRKTFEVSSHAILKDMDWVYSPVSRTYEIDYDTVIIEESGAIEYGDFLDYGELARVDEVYTVVAEGTQAELIVKNDFAKNGVHGEIYDIAGGVISIKDTLVYTEVDKKWEALDLSNTYSTINILDSSIIVKNNKIIEEGDLVVGDVIKVLTTDDLITELSDNNSRAASGIIILVEE